MEQMPERGLTRHREVSIYDRVLMEAAKLANDKIRNYLDFKHSQWEELRDLAKEQDFMEDRRRSKSRKNTGGTLA